MAARKPIKRAGSIRLRVSEDVLERLDRIAALYGVPRATLASLALGQFAAQHERNIAMAETISHTLGERLGEAVERELGEQLSLIAKLPAGD